jgi:hypothetical protein
MHTDVVGRKPGEEGLSLGVGSAELKGVGSDHHPHVRAGLNEGPRLIRSVLQ